MCGRDVITSVLQTRVPLAWGQSKRDQNHSYYFSSHNCPTHMAFLHRWWGRALIDFCGQRLNQEKCHAKENMAVERKDRKKHSRSRENRLWAETASDTFGERPASAFVELGKLPDCSELLCFSPLQNGSLLVELRVMDKSKGSTPVGLSSRCVCCHSLSEYSWANSLLPHGPQAQAPQPCPSPHLQWWLSTAPPEWTHLRFKNLWHKPPKATYLSTVSHHPSNPIEEKKDGPTKINGIGSTICSNLRWRLLLLR